MACCKYFRSSSCPNVLVTANELMIDRLKENFNVVEYKGDSAMPRNLFLKYLPMSDGLLCLVRDQIDSELLDLAKHLRIVSTASVGTDHIDTEACKKREIEVANTPDVLTETTAETTVALLLATARRFPEAIDEAKCGRWNSWSPYYMCGNGIIGSIVGIIGLGRIGLSVAEKLGSFHPSQILYHNRKPNTTKAAKVGATYATLEKLLRSSDFVILTCAATAENRGLICKKTLALMKSNAVLINTSRGSLVVQEDLYEALVKKQIYAAGLDVTTPEPLTPDHPLFKLNNCIILPHIGSATFKTRRDMMSMAESALLKKLRGLTVSHDHF